MKKVLLIAAALGTMALVSAEVRADHGRSGQGRSSSFSSHRGHGHGHGYNSRGFSFRQPSHFRGYRGFRSPSVRRHYNPWSSHRRGCSVYRSPFSRYRW